MYKGDVLVVILYASGTTSIFSIVTSTGYIASTLAVEGISAGLTYPTDTQFAVVGLTSAPAIPTDATCSWYACTNSSTEKTLVVCLKGVSETALVSYIIACANASGVTWTDEEKNTISANVDSVSAEIESSLIAKSFVAYYIKGEEEYVIDITYSTVAVSLLNMAAGDMILTISAHDGDDTPPSTLTSWPAAQISSALNVAIPTFTGSASTYSVSVDAAKSSITITINNTSNADYQTYCGALTSAGFTYSAQTDKYTLTDNSGGVIEISATLDNDSNDVYTMVVTASYKASGGTTSWPTGAISNVCSTVTVPAIVGATSIYSQSLTDMVMIIAYGITQAEIDTYKGALTSAGFSDNRDNSYTKAIDEDYNLEVSLTYSSTDSAVTIYIMKMEIEKLLYTFPTNFKLVYTVGSSYVDTYTFIKIGDSYLYESDYYRYYYVKNGEYWSEYVCDCTGTGSEKVWGEWELATDYDYDTDTEVPVVHDQEDLLDRIAYSTSYFLDIGYVTDNSYYVKQAEGEIAFGIECDKYVYAEDDNSIVTYWINPANGLVMKYTSIYNSQVYDAFNVTMFDTTVTDFVGITLPNLPTTD